MGYVKAVESASGLLSVFNIVNSISDIPSVSQHYWWVSQHLDPLVEPERVEMPAIHRGQRRLPCVEVYGPQPQTITARWSRQHSREWTIWQTEWRQEGFREDFSEELCDRVLTDISSATLAWSSEPTYDLTWTWCEIVEEYASDAERYPQALWAFALWGRTSMCDVIEQIEEIDHKLHIKNSIWNCSTSFPLLAFWIAWSDCSALYLWSLHLRLNQRLLMIIDPSSSAWSLLAVLMTTASNC